MVISIVNQKGGVGKTTTCANLGIGLAKKGKKVLLIDFDPQGSLTASLGFEPDELNNTVSDIMGFIINDKNFDLNYGVLSHKENIELLPANIELSGVEISLVNTLSRETVLKEYINKVSEKYDYVIIDANPSLGMLTINALAAAKSVIIPVQAQYLPIKGLEQLLITINKVRRQINPCLAIEGILLTMVDKRTNFSKEIIELINNIYGDNIYIYKEPIPPSVRVSEASAEGRSVFSYDPKGKAAKAYTSLVEEVLKS
jgi:chromosome partitioning protein